MEIHQEKNKCCDCVISQPKADQYTETCKCEFDEDFSCGKKDKRGLRGERLEDMNQDTETFPPNSRPPPPLNNRPPPPNNRPTQNNYNNNNAAPGNNACCQPQQPQQAQLGQQQQCGQSAQMQGCTEDPYAALGECVRECMLEKGQLARTCGFKCPDCNTPDEKSGKLQQADGGDKPDKGAKGGKGGKADKGAKGGKGGKGKKKPKK